MENVKIKLKTKFVVTIVTVVILFGTINTYLIREITIESLGDELQRRGQFIAQSLAEHIINSLLHEDYLTMQNLVDEIKALDKDVVYAFILNNRAQIIAHNFDQNYPGDLIQANLIVDGQKVSVKLISNKTNQEVYRDIAVPILDGELGTVRIGLKEKSITRQINRATFVFTLMVILFLVGGIGGAFVFSNLITKPISKIVRGFEQLNLDVPPKPVRVKTHDEIEYLANKFNQMAFRLQTTHQDLLKAQEKLAHTEKLASIGTLSAGLAHEINNPLSGLKSCLNRIKKRPDQKEINKYSDLMTNALEKIERVVQDLLHFSRKGSNQMLPVSINDIIQTSFPLIKHQLTKQSIKLIKGFAENIDRILGDPYQLEQVILNLILNAIDAMPNGGELTIKTAQNNDKIFISITDTGSGITAEHLKQIFDPFFTTKDPGKGTGLGLPISHSFIKAHGGDISVDSKPMQGSRIKIWLPVYSGNKNTISNSKKEST